MNTDVLKGKWKQLRGDLKSQWGKLTDHDLEEINGQREKLTGKLQERYGLAKDEVNRQVDQWLSDK